MTPLRQFYATFTRDQTDAMRAVVRYGQGMDLLAAIGANDDDVSVYYLRKFARSLDPDQIDRMKQILTRKQVELFSTLTGVSV